jgi:hypothetical protein
VSLMCVSACVSVWCDQDPRATLASVTKSNPKTIEKLNRSLQGMIPKKRKAEFRDFLMSTLPLGSRCNMTSCRGPCRELVP